MRAAALRNTSSQRQGVAFPIKNRPEYPLSLRNFEEAGVSLKSGGGTANPALASTPRLGRTDPSPIVTTPEYEIPQFRYGSRIYLSAQQLFRKSSRVTVTFGYFRPLTLSPELVRS